MNDKLAVQSPGLAYRLLSIPLYLFWILHAVKHGAKHGLPGYLSMRLFGFAGDGGGDRVWVHAAPNTACRVTCRCACSALPATAAATASGCTPRR
jgi:hypothetical protein